MLQPCDNLYSEVLKGLVLEVVNFSAALYPGCTGYVPGLKVYNISVIFIWDSKGGAAKYQPRHCIYIATLSRSMSVHAK